MPNDESAQKDPGGIEAVTEPIDESTAQPEPVATKTGSRWSALREPARSHPIGAALLAAGVGLIIGFAAGTVADAHPMLSLTVGTAPSGPPAVPADGGPGTGHPPPDRGHGPGHRPPPPHGADAPPPPPGADAPPPPPGADAPPPPPGTGPSGPGRPPTAPPGTGTGPGRPPTPQGGERSPSGSVTVAPPVPGGATPAPSGPPLPAER